MSLRYYGDPVLRQKALPIEEITDEVRQLAHDMIEVMRVHNGVGLAAPQVGRLVRLFISNIEREDDDGKLHFCEPVVYINPVISHVSDSCVERSEGCLSIPKLYADVIRPFSVTVEALDVEGKAFKKECAGFLARNILHENDHLNGTLFVDRIKGKRRTALESELRCIKQHFYTSRAGP